MVQWLADMKKQDNDQFMKIEALEREMDKKADERIEKLIGIIRPTSSESSFSLTQPGFMSIPRQAIYQQPAQQTFFSPYTAAPHQQLHKSSHYTTTPQRIQSSYNKTPFHIPQMSTITSRQFQSTSRQFPSSSPQFPSTSRQFPSTSRQSPKSQKRQKVSDLSFDDDNDDVPYAKIANSKIWLARVISASV